VTGRSLLARIPGAGRVPRIRQSLGLRTFGTKSFEFWTLLAVTLWSIRPRSIVELGSGRSTLYIADYATKEGLPFASIEQNRRWARRIRLALRAGLVDPTCVHHVPVVGDWYDAARVDRLVPDRREMVFVDGPVGVQESLGNGDRAGATARLGLRRLAATAHVIVVDDVQRPENLTLCDELAAAANLSTLYLAYAPEPGVRNVVAVSVSPVSLTALRETCAAVSIALADRPSAATLQYS
jgi:hypothetical protein